VQWLKRAFAVDPPGPAVPTEQELQVVDRVCQEIARRRLTTPALIFLEMARPLNYLGAQAMHFFRPIVSAVVDTTGYAVFAALLERRGSVDLMCRRIEHFEAEYERRERGPTGDGEPDEGPGDGDEMSDHEEV
jgi:hypothetical protein